ncbi:hypothetical protein [Phocaeicola coprophilus]|uniref:hypothetical protein n=1 Tax=Phocaeicola coprophilus TaxID=387090 RepID=UPI00266F5320|nr:hypothetical protein [Phocaeicola coprophilus]
MKETLLKRVRPETLEKLLSAVSDVLSEIKDAVPNKIERLRDESYSSLLVMNYDAFQTLRWHEQKKQEDKDTQDNPA